jgi:hypothetical protein
LYQIGVWGADVSPKKELNEKNQGKDAQIKKNKK